MEIKLQRIEGYADFTLGTVHVDGRLVSFSLEDEKRDVKIMSETRIPAGRYKILLRTVGRIHENYKAKFTWHKGVPWLQEVPGFQYILMHIGNTDEDTAGCLLVGNTCNVDKNLLSSSTIAYEKLCREYIYKAFERKEEVWITVCDEV